MYRYVSRIIPTLCTGFIITLLSNCASTPRMTQMPQPTQRVIDQIVILADTSTSISQSESMLEEFDTIHSFIQLLPEGNYSAGMSAFDTLPHTLVPIKKFNRKSLLNELDKIVTKGGTTEMQRSLNSTQDEIEDKTKRTAIIIFSDGNFSDDPAAIYACQDLIASHPGKICIHTVLVGSDSTGAGMLQRLSSMTSCGSFRAAGSLNTTNMQHAFIDEVFFGIKSKPSPGPVQEPDMADSDGDGVPDDKDQCPDTPKGATVNADGCWDLPILYFDYNKADVRSQYNGDLKSVASVLKQNEGIDLQIEGHTDSIGSESFNAKLSLNRANEVMKFLLQEGVTENRMSVKGMGFSQPVKPNTTAENRQANRRVELTPVK